MKILLIHQYAGNKGDRAVLYALVEMIKAIDKNTKISVSTSDPELWKDFPSFSYNDITFVPSAWDFDKIPTPSKYWDFLKRYEKYTFTLLRESYLAGIAKPIVKYLVNPEFYQELKSSDQVISVGGHHFTTILSRDLVSSINYDAMAVLGSGKDLTCFSQSFGPFQFHNPHNLKLTQKLLNCSSLYAREDQSKEALLDFGVKPTQIKRTFESVLTLNRQVTQYVLPSQREKKIGIAIYATQKREPEVQKTYIANLAGFCDYVNGKGFSVCFFPMELKNTPPDDRPLIKEILDKVRNRSMCSLYDADMNTPTHLKEVSKCRMFVGHKTHSTIFALACGTPLIGIAYHPKTIEFMKQYGVENYCIDDQHLSVQFLIDAFEKMNPELDQIGQSLYNQSRDKAQKIIDDLKTVINK